MNVEQLRSFVARERERIKERHRFGVSGSEIVEENTRLVDQVITRVYQAALQERMIPAQLRFALIALGGYGRRELNPYSDVDIMILTDGSRSTQMALASFASHLVATLWDAGFEVGHSTRSIRDCVQILREDTISRTSLMEARFILGDQALFQAFNAQMRKTLFRNRLQEFVRTKIREWEARHQSYGRSIYVQEPDVKEGVGGLRDVHTAFWIAQALYGIKDIREFPQLRILTEEMTQQAQEALDFLWRVRNELHFLKGRRQDQLTFELQQPVAHNLGYQDSDHTLAEEYLMRDYFRYAQCLYQVSQMVVDRAQRPSLWRRWWQERRRIRLEEGVFIQGKALHLMPERAPKSAYFRLFGYQQQYQVTIHPDTRDAVRQFAQQLGEADRSDPELAKAFMDLMKQPDGLADALRAMHELGLLAAYIPEFAPLLHMVRRDYYHRYTLDEHTFLAIQNLDASTLAQIPYGAPIRDAMEAIERPDLVRLALLLHDVGIPVGGPKAHDQRSAELTHAVLDRFRIMTSDERESVLFLVRHHLLMSRTAQQRDLDDPRVIERFVELLPSEEHLRMLYLLTFADMRAVNVDVWNEWNATLLFDLYTRSLQWIAGEYAETMRQRNELIAETRKRLDAFAIPPARIQRHFDTLPERAWQGMSPEEIAFHIRIIEDLQHQPFILRLREQHEDYSSLILTTHDAQGLFHRITGVFAASQINILSAQLFTREDGIVLNLFHVTGPRHRCLRPEEIPQLEKQMQSALAGQFDFSVLDKLLPSEEMKRRGIQSEVVINNEESETYTIIDIHTEDRLGLLYTITGVFCELGLDIGLAKIATEAHSVADAFYVLNQAHRKITDPQEQETVRQALLKVLP